jgi:hypothetical protein
MSEYVRPVIAERTYFDNDGRVIEYGNRPPDVGGDGLPRGTNMFTNEDRFLPIFTVADALIEHIQAEFDVTLSELTRFPNPFRTGEPQTTEDGDVYSRIIRIDPARADQAPLTIGFGRTPGQVDVMAGFFSQFDMWFCGCDACDDRWQDTADSLEAVLLGVAQEGLTEVIPPRRRARAEYWLSRRRRTEWTGSMSKTTFRPADVEKWSRVLNTLPQSTWAAYSRRVKPTQ